MHPKLVRTLLTALALSGAAAAMPASAQSISINNGTACNYTSFTVSAGANGLPSYNFTAAGCNLGSGTPTSGTMQFSSAGYGSISTGGTAVVSITNTGRITGGGNNLNGSVTSATTGICTVPVPSNVTFSDADTSAKNVTVTAVSPGTCTLNLAGTGTGSPSQATLTITNPNTPGVIAFTTASQSAAPAGPSVTFTVAQTGAGATSPAAGVSYACVAVASNAATWTPVFTPAATGTLSWASGENANKTFTATVPALPSGATSGTITCQLSSPTGAGVTLGTQTTHQVNVTSVPAPVCTITASPNSLVTTTGGSVSFSSTCSNSPNSYTWTAVTSGAPAITGSASTASATFGTGVAVGNYVYQLVAANAGGSSSPAQATVAVTAAPAANCVVKDRASLYPGWTQGNAYSTAGAPLITQGATDTYAFKMSLDDLLDNTQAPSGAGAFQLYEALQIYHTVSISVNPCEFTDAPTGTVCQMSNNTGSFGPRYARWTHPASDATLSGAGYCRLPNPGAQQFLYVNVRFAGPPTATVTNPNPITAPSSSTCTPGACSYYPLYIRF